MSMSTEGGSTRQPSTVSTGKKPGAGKPPADAAKSGGAKTTSGAKAGGAKTSGTGSRPGGAAKSGPGVRGGGGKGPRKPITPVKVGQGRPWGPIALFAAVIAVALGIIGFGGWYVWQGNISWQDRAKDIDGIVNFRETSPQELEVNKHQNGPLQWKMSPPVGGVHNPNWQNCMGDVYPEPIASEHAVHSLEHGAVWVTYRPDLTADQVEALAAKVRGKEKLLMSPFPNLDRPISLQAWGYQLKVDNASDKRIDDFIKALRINASVEGASATCTGGITVTGTTPRDLGGS
ncbi:MAG TPA: DUF3105 domain-containing protein [Micromonosporaceae bacterium]|nr:DUF3105 domain-containing protein [Micromonosporaceae bacterium]